MSLRDDVEVTRVSVHDLDAIAARGSPTHARRLEHNHTQAGFRQMDGGRQTCVPGADDADIGIHMAL
jgi:hypothetical protein